MDRFGNRDLKLPFLLPWLPEWPVVILISAKTDQKINEICPNTVRLLIVQSITPDTGHFRCFVCGLYFWTWWLGCLIKWLHWSTRDGKNRWLKRIYVISSFSWNKYLDVCLLIYVCQSHVFVQFTKKSVSTCSYVKKNWNEWRMLHSQTCVQMPKIELEIWLFRTVSLYSEVHLLMFFK